MARSTEDLQGLLEKVGQVANEFRALAPRIHPVSVEAELAKHVEATHEFCAAILDELLELRGRG